MNKLIRILISLYLALALNACSIYRIDVQQGNVLSPAAVDKIKIGMNRHTVKSILGVPTLNDPFKPDRWDYIYSLKLGNENKQQQSHITLLFNDDKLKDIIIVKPPINEKELLIPKLQRQ